MDLQQEGEVYRAIFDKDDRRPVTEACRESIQVIASSDCDTTTGETRFTDDGIGYAEILARIAIHANNHTGEPLELSQRDLAVFEQALGNFSAAEYIKKAIHEEVQRSGVLHNPRIEARVDLARRAGTIFKDIIRLKKTPELPSTEIAAD
ncbi:MAG TPA: hypothetical protein VFP32_02510 [Candidatus Saccharimonadales bacterium]|nr:hypothetical protein [Candidatus Saccharimonadales bacterium]